MEYVNKIKTFYCYSILFKCLHQVYFPIHGLYDYEHAHIYLCQAHGASFISDSFNPPSDAWRSVLLASPSTGGGNCGTGTK